MQVIRINKVAMSLIMLLLPVIFISTKIYLQVKFYKIALSTTSTETQQTLQFSQESNSEFVDEFLVNTLGCKMSKLPVMSPKIQEFFVPPKPVVCSPPAITESDECKTQN